MPATREQILDKLRTVKDPELHRDIVSLNMVKSLEVEGTRVRLDLELTTPACPMKDRIQTDVNAALKTIPEVETIDIEWSAQVRSSRPGGSALPNIKNVVAVGAGKGGVGKSTIAVLLAYGLHRAGAKVGLMDSDVYGPSIPTMTGIEGQQPRVEGQMLIPPDAGGVKIMSIGFMVERDKPLIWRGPMAHGAFRQLATQTDWGDLDYLIIDLPPGTGDVPLTMSQLLPLTGAVIVCTPQRVAQDDARRAIAMFRQLQIDVLGVVENMSYFIGDDGKEYDIFGKGGAQLMAEQMQVPFLGAVPINMALRENSDTGNPTANFEDDDQLASELRAVVQNLAGQISVATAQRGGMVQPTISVS